MSIAEEDLVREIEAAFSEVPYPGGNNIAYSLTDFEATQYRSDLEAKHWKNIVEPTFLRRHSGFQWFSLAGLTFYLPAILVGAVKYPRESAEWCEPLLLLLYAPDWCAVGLRLTDQLINTLTKRQKHTIRLFLEHLLQREPQNWISPEVPGNQISLMLANCWGQFD